MSQEILNLMNKSNPYVGKLSELFDFKLIHTRGYEVQDNKLIVWLFDSCVNDKSLCEILLQNPQIDTLYLGKSVTENIDGRQICLIHVLLTTLHNINPVIKNIELEDDKKYYVIDGMLIDRSSKCVIDYASGRNKTLLHIPEGVIGLKEHCFIYNEFVSRLEIPTSIKILNGINSLPNLKHLSLYGDGISSITIKDDIIYENSNIVPKMIFIPPFHSRYEPFKLIKSLLKVLYNAICDEADKRRWENILSDDFNYYDEIDRISLSFKYGCYEQEWYIMYKDFPTKLCVGYVLCGERLYECSQLYEEYKVCEICPSYNSCQFLYKRNVNYTNSLVSKWGKIVGSENIMKDIDDTYIYLDITLDLADIKAKILSFLDIALSIRDTNPIGDNEIDGLPQCPF